MNTPYENILLKDGVDFEGYMETRNEAAADLKNPASYALDLVNHFEGAEKEGDTLPWKKTHDQIRFKSGELTLWSGVNGSGKSNILGQIALGFLANQKVCIASLEMKPVTTLARMVRQSLGSDSPTVDYIGQWTLDYSGSLWLYDQTGTVNASRILAVIYYAVETLGVKHFILDSLLKIGNIREDDWNAQKEFVARLCDAAKDTGCHIHLVAHQRKPENEFDIGNKFGVKGSGSISDLAFNSLIVWRNRKKEQQIANGIEDDGTPDALLICDKNRNGDWEGKITLWYDKESMNYRETQRKYP